MIKTSSFESTLEYLKFQNVMKLFIVNILYDIIIDNIFKQTPPPTPSSVRTSSHIFLIKIDYNSKS